jgi:prepilin-type N-terminal cleavage/methylation domain-containing protein
VLLSCGTALFNDFVKRFVVREKGRCDETVVRKRTGSDEHRGRKGLKRTRGAVRQTHEEGFTLIEMSIVLVIIGLIIGSVLAGQDLIRSAGERATISQIEKYNTAVNTFRGKYGALPGDLNSQVATQYGFYPRGSNPGEGDGNGIIEGYSYANSNTSGIYQGGQPGETTIFWDDLTTANGLNVNMIEGGFSLAGSNYGNWSTITGPALGAWIPEAKLGGGNYVYVWSGGVGQGTGGSITGSNNGINYFGITNIANGLNPPFYQANFANNVAGLTVRQAYDIDKKMDDGMPSTGRVTSMHITGAGSQWAIGGGNNNAVNAPGIAASPSSFTCYDNGGNASSPMQYSLSYNNGNGVNCALSFQFQ